MKLASEEFRQLYEARASLLRLHRFWTAFSRLAEERAIPNEKALRIPHLELRCSFEMEDAALTASVITTRGSDMVSDGVLEGSVDEVMQAIPAWLKQFKFTGKEPAAALLVSGALPLLEAGLGIWVASHAAPDLPRRCLVLFSSERKDLEHLWSKNVAIGQKWRLAGPFSSSEIEGLYERLGLRSKMSPSSVGESVRVVGGFKTGDGLVGRTAALPHLLTASAGNLTIRPHDSSSPAASLASDAAGLVRVEASGPLDGRYVIRLEEEPVPGVDPLAIERSLLFYKDAEEHASLTSPETSRWCVQAELAAVPEMETEPEELAQQFGDKDCLDESATVFEDLLEAIYAEGRAGWSEQELVSATSDILGPGSPSPWDVLRVLHESGWLLPAVSTKWRARRWWLRPPGLVLGSSHSYGQQFALLKGSASAAIKRRFVLTAKSLGAQVSQRRGVGPYSPVSLFAHGGAVDSLTTELGWQREPFPRLPTKAAPNCWPSDMSDAARHVPVATWSWKWGMFLSVDDGSSNGVVLRRFRRTAGDRPDLYTVEEGPLRSTWVSRTVAIAEAYRRAAAPLLASDEGLFLRAAADGYLPLPLATLANLRTGQCSGPVWNGESWTYAYAMDGQTERDVRRLLGKTFIAGDKEVSARAGGLSSAMVGRMRGRSGFRPSTTSGLVLGNRD